jgi:hypothetical protein
MTVHKRQISSRFSPQTAENRGTRRQNPEKASGSAALQKRPGKTAQTMRPVEISFISGKASKNNIRAYEFDTVKTDKTQRYSRERSKNAHGATPSFFSGARPFNPQNFRDAWPLSELCAEAALLFADPIQDIPAGCDDYGLLAWAVSALAFSPVMGALLKEAAAEGWHLALDDLDTHDFHLDVPDRLIIIGNNGLSASALGQSGYFRNILLVSMIRGLRDAWQEKRHGGFDSEYPPETVLALERVRAADLDVIATLAGWELRSEGYTELWRHLIGSEEGDIAMCFSTHLERDPAALFNGAALASAFARWFRNEERVDACDHETLEYIDEVLAANPGTNPFGRTKIRPVNIEILSCMPDKTAYLRGRGAEILADPLYAGLGDPVNQSHLMHILYDLQVTYAGNVPFRDPVLAAKIFPEETSRETGEAFLETK